MRKFFIVLILLFLASLSFSAACEPRFRDYLQIRVLDAMLRPMEGVAVNVTYQSDFSTSKGYYTVPFLYTQQNGTVYVVVNNLEQVASKVDCNIVIRALYNKKSISKTVVANSHTNIIDLKFDAYSITVQVLDQNNKPLNGATVILNETEKASNENGLAFFNSLKGEHRLFVSFSEGKVEKLVNVQNDSVVSIAIKSYPLKVIIQDENQKPLQGAKITISDKEFFSDSNGIVDIPKVFGDQQKVIAEYGSNKKELDVDLAFQPQIKFVFDISPPDIKDLKVGEVGDKVKLSFRVLDAGLESSGITAGAVTVRYSVDGGDLEKASVFVKSKNDYNADIPKPPKGSLLLVMIEASDKDGNKNSLEGRVTITGSNGGVTPPPQPPPPTPPSNDGGLPLVEIIVGILIIAVVIYLVSRLKRGVAS